MRKSHLTIFTAAVFVALTGNAMAQYHYGRQTPVYPPRGQGLLTQTLGFQRLSQQAQRGAIANDCTDYGQGDCAERMARRGNPNGPGYAITGGYGGQRYYGGNGYGGQPYGRPVYQYQRPFYGYGQQPMYGGGYHYHYRYEHRYGVNPAAAVAGALLGAAIVASQQPHYVAPQQPQPENVCQANYRKANSPVFNRMTGTLEARQWFKPIVVPLMGEANTVGLQYRYPGASAYIFVGSMGCYIEIDGQYYNQYLLAQISSGDPDQLARAEWYIREAAKIQGF